MEMELLRVFAAELVAPDDADEAVEVEGCATEMARGGGAAVAVAREPAVVRSVLPHCLHCTCVALLHLRRTGATTGPASGPGAKAEEHAAVRAAGESASTSVRLRALQLLLLSEHLF